MRDGAIRADDSLAAADRAVRYVLDRIQHDEDLRHHMLLTEAMHLLCVAEAERLGDDVGAVEKRRCKWKGEGRPRPRVVRYEEVLEKHDLLDEVK